MQIIWKKWVPIEGIMGSYIIAKVENLIEGFRVTLASNVIRGQKIRIFFEDSVYAYRCIESPLYEHYIKQIKDSDSNFFVDCSVFFKVENSLYLQWLSEQSDSWSDEFELVHFGFIGSNRILEVANDIEPDVEIVEGNL